MKLLFGLILLVLGIIASYDGDHSATERLLPALLVDLIWFGPAMVLLGAILLVRETTWGTRFLTRRKTLVTGLAMSAISLVTWIWTLATDHGGDASWAKGMTAIMSTIYVGFPGLLLTLASFLIIPMRSAQHTPSK